MEAIKKQAAKLREQVAKQQQAILKHLGHLNNDAILVDEAELHFYQHLQDLYSSTRAAKHFQKNIVRGVDTFLSISSKQTEIARKLAEDCCKYGADNEVTNSHIARAALQFGNSHNLMENERENFVGILSDQVCVPLRALITGAPLEDARHLAHRYEKLRQEVEAQAAEVLRRRSKTRESEISAENCAKLRNAETRLTDLKSTLMALGREATEAMSSVENQQQQITVQRIFAMVDAERCYHQHVLNLLDKVHAEMILEEQLNEASSELLTTQRGVNESVPPPLTPAPMPDHSSNGHAEQLHGDKKNVCFLAKVIHSFDAQAEGELSLSIGDYVVVRQVSPTGWSEGECKGKAGWFPSAYIEEQQTAPAGEVTQTS